MKLKRFGLLSASLLGLACSSDPLTTEESFPAGHESTPAAAPDTATPAREPSGDDIGCSQNRQTEQLGAGRVEVDGDDLVLHFENLSTSGGVLSANVLVDSPDGLSSTATRELGRFDARETASFRLSRADVSELDLAGHEWTDARVNFEYALDDGRIGGDQAAIFTEYGKESVARPVMSSGNGRGLLEVAVPEKVTLKAGETFKVCFDHVISFPAAETRNIDYFKASGNYTVPAYAIFVKGTVGSTNHFVFANASDGCATFPRTAGSWTFTLSLDSMNLGGVNEFYVSAMKDGGGFPAKQIGPYTVSTSTTDLGRKAFTMAAGDEAKLQHMFVMAQHTVRRAMSLGTVVKPNSVLTLKFTTSGSNYDHATRTVLINRNAAQLRGATSHEVGHWIHRSWMTTTLTKSIRDDTYCTPGGDPTCTVPPADGCARSPSGGHQQEMIEWDGVAHLEGIADFFHVLAFNKTTEESPNGGANCIFPGWSSAATERMYNCDAVGLYMKTGATGGGNCYEWTRSSIFGYVGNQLDWTKLYWDLAADETGLGASRLRSYLTYEEAATGWGKGNHSARLLAAMGTSAMNSAFRRAAVGNIWDGATH